jgi:multidrug resistance protein, MATE family
LLRRSCTMTLAWGLGLCAVLAVVFYCFSPQIIALMAKSPSVQSAAALYAPFIVAAPLVGIIPWMLDGIFIGATRSRDMRDMMAISLVIYAVCAVLLVGQFGNYGLWCALLISFVARAVTLGVRYPRLEKSLTQP